MPPNEAGLTNVGRAIPAPSHAMSWRCSWIVLLSIAPLAFIARCLTSLATYAQTTCQVSPPGMHRITSEGNRAFPVRFTICKWRPKAYQVRKALSFLAFPSLARCSL
jgi:hypothetical protein